MEYIKYFQWWELNHIADRAEQYAISNQKLHQAAIKMKKKEKISKNNLENCGNILKKLSKITAFDKVCLRENCEICERLVNLNKLEIINHRNIQLDNDDNQEWYFDYELWRWQKKCKELWWKNGSTGIAKVITGAGKTFFALSIMSELKNKNIYKNFKIKFVIVVPNKALLFQWKEEIELKLNIPSEKIGIFYGKNKNSLKNKDIMILVINSARSHLVEMINEARKTESFDTFLIADECHRYGSKKNSQIFNYQYDYTLGLSATPERQGDYAFQRILVPKLGKVIFEYSYDQAIMDGVISSYNLFRISINLTTYEEDEYNMFSIKISKLHRQLLKKYPTLEKGNIIKKINDIYITNGDKSLKHYTTLLIQRKNIVHNAENRIPALKWLIKNKVDYSDKVIIFNERIDRADVIYEFLKRENFSVGVHHSKVSKDNINDLRKFLDGDVNILVSCKSLDEGFDLPEIDTGIIVSATASIRQRVQRMGRVLRKSPGKYRAKIYTIYVKDIEEGIFSTKDMKKLERNANSVKSFELKI